MTSATSGDGVGTPPALRSFPRAATTAARRLPLGPIAPLLVFGVLLYPWIARIRHAVPGEPAGVQARDNHLIVWVLGWVAHALGTDPARLFDTPSQYPAPGQLTSSEHFIGSQVLFAPIYAATGDAVLGANVLALSFYVLAALAMDRLLRALGFTRRTAWVGGRARAAHDAARRPLAWEGDGFDLLEVVRPPRHSFWFDGIAHGERADETILGTPLRPLAPADAVAHVSAPRWLARRVTPRAPFAVPVEVVHAGTRPWPVLAQGSTDFTVEIAAEWRRSDGIVVRVQTASLARDVAPGETLTAVLRLRAPRSPASTASASSRARSRARRSTRRATSRSTSRSWSSRRRGRTDWIGGHRRPSRRTRVLRLEARPVVDRAFAGGAIGDALTRRPPPDRT